MTAMVYLFTAPVSWLSPSLWSFEEFLNERLHRWVEGGPEDDENDLALERAAEEARANGGT